jgi:hypothetical protein
MARRSRFLDGGRIRTRPAGAGPRPRPADGAGFAPLSMLLLKEQRCENCQDPATIFRFEIQGSKRAAFCGPCGRA